MAKKWGSVDFAELEQLKNKIDDAHMDDFCRKASKELAARLLSFVIPRTPVGIYSEGSGKTGGTLRRGWTGEQNASAKAYAQSLAVQRAGDNYTIEIINPVEYASYVEFGHRQEPGRYVPAIGKKLKKSWAEGKYMLTVSERDLQVKMPSILSTMIEKHLRELVGAK